MRRVAALLAALFLAAGSFGCSPPHGGPSGQTAGGGYSAADYEAADPIAEFSLTDQDGRAVTRSDLLGRVWVASFLFTRCNTLCPQVSASLARLDHELGDKKDVLLVSFSVDPEHDTPAVLKEYAGRFGVTPGRWRLLTGDPESVYQLIRSSFMLPVQPTEGPARTPGNEVSHSPRLAAVDRRGRIRGYFDGRQVDDQGQPVNELPRLREKLDRLLAEAP